MLRNMFKKTHTKIDTRYKPQAGPDRRSAVPKGLRRKCNKCEQPIYVEDVKNDYYVHPKYNGYSRVHAYRHTEMLADEGAFEEWDEETPFSNPLNFLGYEKRVIAAREKSRPNEATITDKCKVDENSAVVGVYDTRFVTSSMGHTMSEKITDVVKRATREKLPVILFACLDGVRIQEGIVSLMWMAGTSAALERHHKAGQLSISVLTGPTTGGITASFAILDDIILAELHALIGFTGPGVVEQTIRQRLPEGFQRFGFLLEYGFMDKVVEQKDQKRAIGQTLYTHRSHKMNIELKSPMETARVFADKPSQLQADSEKTVWGTVLPFGKPNRPIATDYISALSDEFIEFHGNWYSEDDGAVVSGVATFHGVPVTIIGQQKGKNTKDNTIRNFGMPFPDGYRKAPRLMKQAGTLNRPVICLVDTPEAFCGLEVEERGQGEAVVRNLFEISDLKVPVLSIAIGEEGNSGALAMAMADEVWILESIICSILPPEGFASILYKDNKKMPDVAKVMRVMAKDLLQFEPTERTVSEEGPVCADNLYHLAGYMDSAMAEFLKTYLAVSDEEFREHRYQGSRRMW